MGEVGRLKDWFTKLPFALQDNGLIAFPLNVNDVVGWMFGTWVVVVVMVGIVAMVVGIVAKPFASELPFIRLVVCVLYVSLLLLLLLLLLELPFC